MTRCLVGTRGLLGEGWDALSLNTLIDLTSVTTRTGVRQIRGRSLRLDPQWPRKVAHNWDVVCTSRRFDRGDIDLQRFAARHRHTWGIIVVQSKLKELSDAAARISMGLLASASLQGQITRGVSHVDVELAQELAFKPFKQIQLARYTQRMIAAVSHRDEVYDLWRVGDPYANFIYSATQLEPQDLKFRTVYTVAESLKTIIWRLLTSVAGVAGSIWFYGLLQLRGLGDPTFVGIGVALVLALGVLVTLDRQRAGYLARFPPDLPGTPGRRRAARYRAGAACRASRCGCDQSHSRRQVRPGGRDAGRRVSSLRRLCLTGGFRRICLRLS